MGKSFSGYTVQKNTTKYFLILEYHSLKQGTLYVRMGKEFSVLIHKEDAMISQLIEKIKKTNAPICVGLDPMLSYVPGHVVKKSFDAYGETLEGAADAIWQFNKEIIDHTCDLIPAVKPQIAMYEQFGIEGLIAYNCFHIFNF